MTGSSPGRRMSLDHAKEKEKNRIQFDSNLLYIASCIKKITSNRHFNNLTTSSSSNTIPELLLHTPVYTSPRPMLKSCKLVNIHPCPSASSSILPASSHTHTSIETELSKIKKQIQETLSSTTIPKLLNLSQKELLLEKHLSALKLSSPIRKPRIEDLIYKKCLSGDPLYKKELPYPIELTKPVVNEDDDPHLVITKYSIPIREEDLLTLSPGAWLNDEIINFFISMVAELSNLLATYCPLSTTAFHLPNPAVVHGFPRVYVFNSFFYSKLSVSGYQSIQRWTKKIDLFSNYDLALIPINSSNTHWSLAVIDFFKGALYYLDSLPASPTRYSSIFTSLKHYLIEEWNGKLGSISDKIKMPEFEAWDQVVPHVPSQKNSFDCGVFTIHYAMAIALNYTASMGGGFGVIDSTFSQFQQADMPRLRNRAREQISQGSLLNLFH